VARLIARLQRKEEGSELIEMAIVLPLLLLLIMGIIDFGFLFQRYVVLTNAAAEGARVASLPGYTSADVTARVNAYATNGGIKGSVSAVTTPVSLPGAGGGSWPGSQVTVSYVYNFSYVGPIAKLFGGGSGGAVTLTSRSTMRKQVAAAAAP
jgi:Flp pilus assembly protein TadG